MPFLDNVSWYLTLKAKLPTDKYTKFKRKNWVSKFNSETVKSGNLFNNLWFNVQSTKYLYSFDLLDVWWIYLEFKRKTFYNEQIRKVLPSLTPDL